MAKFTENTRIQTFINIMPAQNLTPEVVRQGNQYYTLEMDQTTTDRKLNKEEKMEVVRTHTQETITHQIYGTPQRRGEEIGHGTPGKETQKGKQKRWDTP